MDNQKLPIDCSVKIKGRELDSETEQKRLDNLKAAHEYLRKSLEYTALELKRRNKDK